MDLYNIKHDRLPVSIIQGENMILSTFEDLTEYKTIHDGIHAFIKNDICIYEFNYNTNTLYIDEFIILSLNQYINVLADCVYLISVKFENIRKIKIKKSEIKNFSALYSINNQLLPL